MLDKAKFKSFWNITNRVQGQSKVISLLGSKQVFIETGKKYYKETVIAHL